MPGGFQPVLDTVLSEIANLWRSFGHIKSNHDLQSLISKIFQSDPLASAVAFSLLVSIICFALSLGTHRHSWVDKIWSILPILYVWHFASHDVLVGGGHFNPRLVIIAMLVTVWGVRLTYNFFRKGGYRWADEDYRWPIIRARMHPAAFQLLNFVFIAFIQNLLLLAITAPAYVAWQEQGAPVSFLDALAAGLLAGFIALEAGADQQQWEFQTTKHAKIAAGKRLTGDYHKGFLTSGLFKYSRHPNFFAEQAIWWSVYLFSVAASRQWLNWSAAGALGLTLLFQGSTWLTEELTKAKYPKYKDYQATTSRLVPWWPFEPLKKRRGRRPAEEVAPEAVPITPATPRRRGRKSVGGDQSPEADEALASSPPPSAAQDAPATSTRSRSRGRRRKSGSGAEAGFTSDGGRPTSLRARRGGRGAAAAERTGRTPRGRKPRAADE